LIVNVGCFENLVRFETSDIVSFSKHNAIGSMRGILGFSALFWGFIGEASCWRVETGPQSGQPGPVSVCVRIWLGGYPPGSTRVPASL
jgi:hypothetical protein